MAGIDYKQLGLFVIDDFISIEEELSILNIIDDKKDRVTKQKNRNSIKRYGSDIPYPANIVSKTIPDYLENINLKYLNLALFNKARFNIN